MAIKDCKPLPPISDTLIERFWSKVDRRGPDECWPWTGNLPDGYGQFRVGKRTLRAPRIAIFLATGIDPFPLLACHSCEERYPAGDMTSRSCCNPGHIYPGTKAQNDDDRVRNKRHPTRRDPTLVLRGIQIGTSKLTEAQVLEIRNSYLPRLVSHRVLAKRFGVARNLIRMIVTRQAWKHLP